MIIVLTREENEIIEKAIEKHAFDLKGKNYISWGGPPDILNVNLQHVAIMKAIEYRRLKWGPSSSLPAVKFVVGEEKVHTGFNLCKETVTSNKKATSNLRKRKKT